jgi:phthalate 4,5-dioxygenase
MIDREVQNIESYAGIAGIREQDQAVIESMGPITDHDFENLGPSVMIARICVAHPRALAKGGTAPPRVDGPGIYTVVRSGDFVAYAKIAWRDAYDMQMRTAVRPLQQAAD